MHTQYINNSLSIKVDKNKTTENINEEIQKQDKALDELNKSLEQAIKLRNELAEQEKKIELINEDLRGCGHHHHPHPCKIL